MSFFLGPHIVTVWTDLCPHNVREYLAHTYFFHEDIKYKLNPSVTADGSHFSWSRSAAVRRLLESTF